MRKWLLIFIPLLLFLIFLPKIASSPLGKPLITKAFEIKTNSQIKIGSMNLSWFGPQKFKDLNYSHDGVTGHLGELEIKAPFWSFSGPFDLKNGQVLYQGGSIDQIHGQIEGENFELKGITQQGHINLSGKIFSKTHYQIQTDLLNFPLSAIDQQLKNIFGPTLNLTGFINMDKGIGIVHLDVSSPTIKANIRANLTKDGLTLRDPLVASFIPNIPNFTVQNPVILNINPKGFFFPLPYDFNKIRIDSASLNLGKVTCRTNPAILSLIFLLKATHISNAKQINAWFAPVAFQLSHSNLELGRLDLLLADSIHICTWGKVNLDNDQLNMFLGLPSDTLQKSFGINILSSNYVMKIPVRGTIQKPEIVSGPAAAKIAALIAARQIPKNKILKGIAEVVSQPKEEKGVPKAVHPFPWE